MLEIDYGSSVFYYGDAVSYTHLDVYKRQVLQQYTKPFNIILRSHQSNF